MLNMNGARVLGLTVNNVSDSAIFQKLARSRPGEGDVDVSLVISKFAPGGTDKENRGICNLRELLGRVWDTAGGPLTALMPIPQESRWTSGPVTEMR